MTASMPAPESIPWRAPGIVVEAVEDEILVYHRGKATALYLNPSAALVLGLCDGARSVQDIVRLLSEGYPEAGAVVRDDVVAAFDKLHGDGVIVFG